MKPPLISFGKFGQAKSHCSSLDSVACSVDPKPARRQSPNGRGARGCRVELQPRLFQAGAAEDDVVDLRGKTPGPVGAGRLRLALSIATTPLTATHRDARNRGPRMRIWRFPPGAFSVMAPAKRRLESGKDETIMHRYRTHTCGALSLAEDGAAVRLSGWCHRIRDHGGLLFIDLRDHYGLTQCVVDPDSPAFAESEKLRSEFVVRVDGQVRRRPPGTENPEMPTGLVEVYVREIEVLGPAGDLPLPVFGDQPYPEETRLRYRFLDLGARSCTRTSCCAGKSLIRSAGG